MIVSLHIRFTDRNVLIDNFSMCAEPLAKVSKGTNFNEKREQTLYDGVI